MDWIIANWQNVLFIILLIVLGAYGIMAGKVNEWLKGIVVEVERDLGSGTGQLKLRKAYDYFVKQFPKFAIIVPFPLFEYWIDQALEWMKKQLESNTKVFNYIENK